ncbi:unnamed protein product, partial [Rotaria sp. Silwood2]
YRVNNYYTGNDNCSPDFEKSLLHTLTQYENQFKQRCWSCGFLGLSTCCHDEVDGIGKRESSLYDCNKSGAKKRSFSDILRIDKNYVFGGSFTSTKTNPVTSFPKCPTNEFKEIRIIDDLIICLAERVASTDNLPNYSGIYSCQQGNIAFNTSKQECLPGYSVHVMGAMEGNCLLMFPRSNHIGCYFHFTQSIYRQIQQLGLSSAYCNDDGIRMTCRKLMALALLPPPLVLKSFEDLHESVLLASSSSSVLHSLKPLFDYFEHYWINTVDFKKMECLWYSY